MLTRQAHYHCDTTAHHTTETRTPISSLKGLRTKPVIRWCDISCQSGTRTHNHSVNSRRLCQLSYLALLKLGMLDSNQRCRSQSPEPCRLANPHYNGERAEALPLCHSARLSEPPSVFPLCQHIDHFMAQSGRRASNPQHLAWRASALPIELLPHIGSSFCSLVRLNQRRGYFLRNEPRYVMLPTCLLRKQPVG